MKSSCEPATIFLFGDGMHLVHQNVPELCWGDPKKPPVIKTNTGRKRLNILGAYNPDTYSFVHLTGEENCDAERVIEYFTVITAAYPAAPMIILFLEKDLHIQLGSDVVKCEIALEINPRVIRSVGLNLYTHCVNTETKTDVLPG